MPPSLRSRALAPLALLFCLTGCLTIEEHYTFRKDGSGSMEYVVDLSEMGEMMESLGTGDDKKKDQGPEGMGTMDMAAQMEAVKAVPGISKVKLDGKKKWVQRLSFSFKDVTALNAALNKLMPDSTGQEHAFFRWAGDTLVRTNNRHAHELGAGFAGGAPAAEEQEEDGLDLASLLGSMKYRYCFKFARRIAATHAAPGMAKRSPGAKEVLLSTDFQAIGRDREALDLRIVLAK